VETTNLNKRIQLSSIYMFVWFKRRKKRPDPPL